MMEAATMPQRFASRPPSAALPQALPWATDRDARAPEPVRYGRKHVQHEELHKAQERGKVYKPAHPWAWDT